MTAIKTYWPLTVKALLTLAFLAAGLSKLLGAEQMVMLYETIGWGQWFRYATGVIEVGSVVLLWIRGLERIGAGLLLCTMVGAVIAHLTVLGPSTVPAVVLGLLAGTILWDAQRKAAVA